MQYQHLRHAAGLLHYGTTTILLDPMLAPREVNPPIADSWNDRRNPLTDLPLDLSALELPEYCLVTHLHRDHFDDYARELLVPDVKLLCQTDDEARFIKMGFVHVLPINQELAFAANTVYRVEGQHGTGEIARAMGTSSGYILKTDGEPTLYITGDTIFYDAVKATLEKYRPDVIIAFGGTAQFAQGDPITLTPEDIMQIHQTAPQAKIICVHMDAINHCRTTREDLQKFLITNLGSNTFREMFIIPEDGATIIL